MPIVLQYLLACSVEYGIIRMGSTHALFHYMAWYCCTSWGSTAAAVQNLVAWVWPVSFCDLLHRRPLQRYGVALQAGSLRPCQLCCNWQQGMYILHLLSLPQLMMQCSCTTAGNTIILLAAWGVFYVLSRYSVARILLHVRAAQDAAI
jgi:hypothetical protein